MENNITTDENVQYVAVPTIVNTPYVLTAASKEEADKVPVSQDWTYVTFEVKIPKSPKDLDMMALVRDFTGLVSDKDAQLIALRITENRW